MAGLSFGLIEAKEEIISDILREYPEATLKVESNAANDSTDTVYTVPAGKKFALISLTLAVSAAVNMGGEDGRARIAGNVAGRIFGSVAAKSETYTLPSANLIILTEGQVIHAHSSDAGIIVDVAITGYEMPAGI